MKQKRIKLGMLLVLTLIISSLGCLDLAITGLSGAPIPVSIWTTQSNPDGLPGNYWVGSAVVSGSDTNLVATMPAGTGEGDKFTEQEVQIQISNINPYWIAPLETDVTDPLKYYEVDYPFGDWLAPSLYYNKLVPYVNVGPGVMVSSYKVTIDNGYDVQSQIGTSFHDETASPVLKIPVKDSNGITRNVYVKMTSAINFVAGTLPPASTGYSVVDGKRLVEYNDLEGAIHDWNNHALFEYGIRPTVYWYAFNYNDIDSWNDAYSWMNENGKIPDQSFKLGANMQIVDTTKVKLNYPENVFAPSVTFYIPEELAETITIVEAAPEIIFDTISDISAMEGGTHTLHVTGKNKGSPGYVNFNVLSDGISHVIIYPSSGMYITDSVELDVHISFAENIEGDRDFTGTITAQGGLGDMTSQTFNIKLIDSKGQFVETEPYIPGGTEEPIDLTIVVYGIIIVIALLILWKSGIVETIMSNPIWILIIVIVILAVWFGLIAQDAINAIKEFELV